MRSRAQIVVVGGGPGGLCAALSAAQNGAEVTLLDAYPAPGGQYYHQPPRWRLANATRRQMQGRALWQRAQAAGVKIRSEVLVWNASSERILSLNGLEGVEEIQADALILATGAYERPAAFPGWTLPGVITSGAAQILLYHKVRPGKRLLVAGAGPLQLVTAAHLVQAGVKVAAVLEGGRLVSKGLRQPWALWGQWERAREGLESLLTLASRKVPFLSGWGILAAHGDEQVEGATIARLDANWRPIPGTEREVACDTICTGYGLVPFNALSRLCGAEQEWQPGQGGEVPRRDVWMQTSVPGIYAVGDGAGIGGYRMAMLEGLLAGMAASAATVVAGEKKDDAELEKTIKKARAALRQEQAFQRVYASLFTPGPGIYELAQADTLVCRCEGVTQERLEQAVWEGAATSGEIKAATRCGMGECQGRICGHHVYHTLAQMTGKRLEEVGVYSARPPLFPLPLKALGKYF